MIMEDVFRDYGQFENIENKKIICFNNSSLKIRQA